MALLIADDTDPDRAEAALVAIAGHVPLGIPLGRPLIVTTDDDGHIMITTSIGWWWNEHDRASRLLPLAAGVELTEYRRGVELTRTIRSDQDRPGS